MGVAPVAFSSAGYRSEHYIPGAYSRNNFVPGNGGGVSANRVVIMGRAKGGQPNRLLWFGSSTEAANELRGGDLLDGVRHAFSPGGGAIPQQVAAWRVNPGAQAVYELQSGGSTMINLTAWDWGLHTNQLKIKLEDGSLYGKKVTLKFQSNDESVTDNIRRQSFSIQYTGGDSSPSLDISLTALNVTTTEGNDDLSASFASFETVGDLVNYINDQANYVATLITPDESQLASHLDTVTGQDISTAYTCTSNLQALIEALDDDPWIASAVYNDAAGARTIPDDLTEWFYFTGGTEGAYTASEWEAALTLLEGEEVQIIAATSSDAAVHALIKNHCASMNSVEGKRERMFLVGGPVGETVAQTTARAVTINSDAGSLVYPGFVHFDFADRSKTKTYSPAMLACKLAGLEAALAINNPLTNKTLDVLGFESKLTKSELRELIKNGVLACGTSDDGRYVPIRALTTFQSQVLQRNERSMMREALYMARDLRQAISRDVGAPGVDSSGGTEEALFWAKVAEWYNLGLIIQGDNDALAWGLNIRRDGTATYIEYNTYLTPPRNFFFITANQYVYSQSALSVAV